MNLRLCHTKIATCTCDIISNAPAINTINSTLLHGELHNQVNALVKKHL